MPGDGARPGGPSDRSPLPRRASPRRSGRHRSAAPRVRRRGRGRRATPEPGRAPAPPRARSSAAIRRRERRHSQVGQVDPAEQAMPVAVVRLAGVEVVRAHARAPRRRGISATRSLTRSICLWRSLTSRYLIWKLRQIAPRSQRASGRPLGLRVVDGAGEAEGLVGRQRPLAHLRVRPGREVDPAHGPVAVQPGRGRDRRQPVARSPRGPRRTARPSRPCPSSARTSSASRRTSRRRRPSSRRGRRPSVAWSRR